MEVTTELHKELMQAFNEIQMPRTPFVLEELVVNTKFTDEQRYAQCVLEMSIAYDNLRLAQIDMSLKQLQIDELDDNIEKQRLKKLKKQIELEQTQRAVLWAEREFTYLFNLWRKFKKQYTREELNDAQPLEYKMRLETQALLDMQSRTLWISAWNLEWLRQINVKPEHIWLPQQQDDIEKKYLEEWKIKALIIIPSEHRLTAVQLDELLSHVEMPSNVNYRIENIYDSPVADNYNAWFLKAIEEDTNFVVTIEDDQVLQPDSIIKLFDFALDNPNCCVGAWYPKRQKTRQGVHIKLSWWHRRFLDDDWKVHEVKTMAMWLSIYPIEIIKQLDYPYCKTTDALSQDSYLSQKILDKWYKLLVDTSLKIWHKDRDGFIYY